MYNSAHFVSITDIRKNTSFVIDWLKKDKEKIIFKNNKPTAILIDFKYYEELYKNNSIDIEPVIWSEEFIWTDKHKKLISLMKSE